VQTDTAESNKQQSLFSPVQPIRQPIGQPREHEKLEADGSTVPKLVQDECMVVPFTAAFEKLLSNADVMAAVMQHRGTRYQRAQQPDGKICSYYDGAEHKKGPILSQQVDTYIIDMYYDDVTCTDSLGSYQRKLGMVYWTLKDLGAQHQTRLEHIHLNMLVWQADIERHGWEAITGLPGSMVRDLAGRGLQPPPGGEINITGEVGMVHVWPGVWCADTPAAGALCGRNQSYSKAHSMCRLCNAGQSNRLTPQGFLCQCGGLQLLTIKEDKRQRHLWEEAKKAPPRRRKRAEHETAPAMTLAEVQKAYGLKSKETALSHLNQHGAWIANRCPMDVMHVLLEGIVKFTLARFLWYLHKVHHIPVETMNAILDSHPYSPHEVKDRPSHIKKDHLNKDKEAKLKQTASQVNCLARNFYSMFIPTVEALSLQNDVKWKSVCMMLHFLFMCMMQEYTRDVLEWMERFYSEYLGVFETAWGKEAGKPKHHFATHIPVDIYNWGPAVHYWCMRYEAKHQWFKRLARRTSHKNILWTLSSVHQFWMAYTGYVWAHKWSCTGMVPHGTPHTAKMYQKSSGNAHERKMHKRLSQALAVDHPPTQLLVEAYQSASIHNRRLTVGNSWVRLAHRHTGEVVVGELKNLLRLEEDNELWLLEVAPPTCPAAPGPTGGMPTLVSLDVCPPQYHSLSHWQVQPVHLAGCNGQWVVMQE
jgi:hypothetical protein